MMSQQPSGWIVDDGKGYLSLYISLYLSIYLFLDSASYLYVVSTSFMFLRHSLYLLSDLEPDPVPRPRYTTTNVSGLKFEWSRGGW